MDGMTILSHAGGGGPSQRAGGGRFAHWKQRLETVSCFLVFHPPPRPPPKGYLKWWREISF